MSFLLAFVRALAVIGVLMGLLVLVAGLSWHSALGVAGAVVTGWGLLMLIKERRAA